MVSNSSGGEYIGKILVHKRVSHIFTLCGGHISPILVGCKNEGIKVIDVRHEANAVFAADATARITGIPGVAVVTAGPGVTNTITAVKNAQMAQSPLLLFGGAAATVIKGRGSLQDVDQIPLLKKIVKLAVSVKRNCDIAPAIEKAFQAASSGVTGPVFVEFPIDLLYDEDLVRRWYGISSSAYGKGGIKSRLLSLYLNRHVDKMFACDLEDVKPGENSSSWKKISAGKVRKGAGKISDAKKPVMIIGSQALVRPEKSILLADAVNKIGMPVFLTGMARGLLGKSNSIQIRHRRREALKEADLVLLAGMPSDFRLDYGRAINSEAYLVSVNRNIDDLNLNRKPNLGIHNDPFEFIFSLGQLTQGGEKQYNDWLTTLKGRDEERDKEIEEMKKIDVKDINPLLLLSKIDSFMDDSMVVVADGGDFVASASYIIKPRGPLSWLDPGVFGTLGVGAGFAMGAKLAKPEKNVILLYGDGAAGYSLIEFDSFLRHGIPITAIIGNDGGWAQIERDQMEYLHDDVATKLAQSDYHLIADAFGGKGFLLEDINEMVSILKEAMSLNRKGIPVLINAKIGKTDFRKGSISM